MMRQRGRFVYIAAVLLCVQAARADDGPLLAPTTPVAVIYQLSGASQQQGARKMQVTYGSQGRVRMDFYRYVESKDPFAWLIYDPPTNRITTVLPERHGYVQRDVAHLPSPGAFLTARMNFTRQGNATIAGLPCTDWHVFNGSAGGGSACVTDDGVVLRATREQPAKGLIEAVAVNHEALPPNLFVPPAEFNFIPSPDFPDIKPPTQDDLPPPPR